MFVFRKHQAAQISLKSRQKVALCSLNKFQPYSLQEKLAGWIEFQLFIFQTDIFSFCKKKNVFVDEFGHYVNIVYFFYLCRLVFRVKN